MTGPENLLDTDLIVDSIGRVHLRDSATWAKFLGVAGLLYSLLIVIFTGRKGLSMFKARAVGVPEAEVTVGGISILVFSLVAAGIIFLMSLHFLRFSKNLRHALNLNEQVALNEALRCQRLYFRFAALFTSILLVLTILVLIGLMLGPQ